MCLKFQMLLVVKLDCAWLSMRQEIVCCALLVLFLLPRMIWRFCCVAELQALIFLSDCIVNFALFGHLTSRSLCLQVLTMVGSAECGDDMSVLDEFWLGKTWC